MSWIDAILPNRDAVLVIAEAGVNHNGDMDLARQMIDTAASAGADAVKFQSFRVDRLLLKSAPKASYQAVATGAAESQYDMLHRLQLSDEQHVILKAHCDARGILFLSTPFEEESADYLRKLGVPALKIPSGEVTNLPFLSHVAQMGLPIILSTGMATIGEVEAAVRTLEVGGKPDLTLLHCVSSYPADPADANLRAMATLRSAFGYPVGYSDHTPGVAVALAAAALGARVIEKHFTLDRHLPGPDHQASLEPVELADMVVGIRMAALALGDGIKHPRSSERNTAEVARKSLVAACDIPAGVGVVAEMLSVRRPGTGLPPAMLEQVIGLRTRRAIARDTVLSWTDFG